MFVEGKFFVVALLEFGELDDSDVFFLELFDFQAVAFVFLILSLLEIVVGWSGFGWLFVARVVTSF